MVFIQKVRKYSVYYGLILICMVLPINVSAEEIVDTSSPRDPLVAPAIVVRSSTVEPDCHTYTGCSVVIVKTVKKPIYHHHKPKPKHCVYQPPHC